MFPALVSLMEEEIEEQNLKGGLLMETISQRCVTGNPVIKAMFTKLLFYCTKVLLQQINAWIVHGQLVDLCEEFFIHRITNNQTPPGKQEGNLDVSKVNKSANPTSVGSISNLNIVGTILTMDPDRLSADNDGKDDEWNTAYTLRMSMLPAKFISPQIAEKILFIGKAIRVLQSKSTSTQDRVPLDDLEAFSEAILRLQQMPEFNSILFSKVIELIRESIANRLLHLVVIKTNLLDHLKTMKDFFLLTKGEFYQTFLEEAR